MVIEAKDQTTYNALQKKRQAHIQESPRKVLNMYNAIRKYHSLHIYHVIMQMLS